MKQLMDHLGLDIPKWEGPTVCESSTANSESCTDVKPSRTLAADEKVKKERKREATSLTDNVKEEETGLVKRERVESPSEMSDDKKP